MAKKYEIYVPLRYNDGSKIEKSKIDEVREKLLSFFEGVTFLPQKNQGFWKAGGVMYRDEIVIFLAVTLKTAAARKFLKSLKAWMKKEFMQEELFIVETSVETF